jgi:hypothetical protein
METQDSPAMGKFGVYACSRCPGLSALRKNDPERSAATVIANRPKLLI